jgi:hypothetical protein
VRGSIAVVNWSDGRIDDAALAFASAACDDQLAECARAWGLDPWPVTFVSSTDSLPLATTHVMAVVDTIDVAGAAGYHNAANGVIYGKVLVRSVSQTGMTLSHECVEMLVDPDAQAWRGLVALEACDPVEPDGYPYPTTILGETRRIQLSNYVLPSWFDPAGKPPFDRLGKLSAPLTSSPGGYQIVRDEQGNTSTVFASRDIPAGLAAKRAIPFSRVSRRLAGAR